MTFRRFHDCSLDERLLYTCFLVLMGIGYLMGVTYIFMNDAGRDGKRGLSVEDIVYNYYGNRSGTRLETAIRGPMAGFIDENGRHQIVAWLKSGADETAYEATIRPILTQRCIGCHSAASGMKIPDLSNYAGVSEVANVDTGQSLFTLVKLSHIHLFGIGLILFGVGYIFCLAVLPVWLKTTLILTPFVAVFIDIAAWFLTKWDPFYAWTVMISGAMMGIALAAQILISLYQMWFFRRVPPR
jgi:hypothetical protein